MSEQVIYTILALCTIFALALGYALSYIRSRIQVDNLREKYVKLNSRFDDERTETNRKFSNMEKVRTGLEQTLTSLAVDEEDKVEQTISSHGDQVKVLLRPLQIALQETDLKVKKIQAEADATASLLEQQIATLKDHQKVAFKNAKSIAETFSNEKTQKNWGKDTLKALLDDTQMRQHCHSCKTPEDTPEHDKADSDTTLLPAILELPDESLIAIDANLSLAAYINVCAASDEGVRTWHLETHARKLREHMRTMASHVYQTQLPVPPTLYVLMVVNEHCISTALESDETLLEDALEHNIVLATPTDVRALLQVTSLHWKQHDFSSDTTRIRDSGINLYKRFGVFAQLLAQLGSELTGVLHSYNNAVTFFEESEKKESNTPPTSPERANKDVQKNKKDTLKTG